MLNTIFLESAFQYALTAVSMTAAKSPAGVFLE